MNGGRGYGAATRDRLATSAHIRVPDAALDPHQTADPRLQHPLLGLQQSAGNRAVHALVRTLAGSGQPLPDAVRDDMQTRFGHDFSEVRVHTDATAEDAATALRAKAFTIGRDIAFGDRRFAPDTFEGRRLLAHELAHVVQQSRGGAAPPAGVPDASLESDANSAAAAASTGGAVAVTAGSGIGVACDPLTQAEIDALDKHRLEARLAANEEESSRKVYGPEIYDALEAENLALKAAIARATPVESKTEAAPGPEPPPDAPEPPAADPDSVLPADPAAARGMQFHGISEYSKAKVPVTHGSGPIHTIKAGPYILGPNAIQCQDGEYAVLYYVAYHKESKTNQWVVGLDSVDQFVADAESHEKTGKPPEKDEEGKEVLPEEVALSMKHAEGMKTTGIKPLYMVESLPATSSGSTTVPSIDAGPYTLVPKTMQTVQGEEAVLYYIAQDKSGEKYDHYIIGPESVDKFKTEADAHYGGAALAYSGGPPHQYEADSVRFVNEATSALLGNGSWSKAWGYWKKANVEASKDPKFILQMAAAVVPVEKVVAPALRPIGRALARGARTTVLATNLTIKGVAESAPSLAGHMAPRASIQMVEQAAVAETRQVATRSVAREGAGTAAVELAPAVAKPVVNLAAPGGAAAVNPMITAATRTTLTTTARGMSGVSKETDADVEQGIREEATVTQSPSPRAPLRQVTRTEEATDTRANFNRIRDAYASLLRVATFGQVHHAIEVQVLSRYPGVYTEGEINQFSQMRGIPPELGRRTQLHNSKIREILDRHYRALDNDIAKRGLQPGTQEYNDTVRAWMNNAVGEIDWALGSFFSEQRAGLPLAY